MCVKSFWSTVSYLLWRGTRSLFFNQVMDRTNVTTYDDDDPPFFFLNLHVISLLYNQPLLNSYQCIFRSHLNSHRLTRRYRKIGNLSGFLFCFLSLSLSELTKRLEKELIKLFLPQPLGPNIKYRRITAEHRSKCANRKISNDNFVSSSIVANAFWHTHEGCHLIHFPFS